MAVKINYITNKGYVCGVAISRLIKVYNPNIISVEQLWGRSWPKGINLVNSVETSVSEQGIPNSQPYRKAQVAKVMSKQYPRRTYTWRGDNLIIYFNITSSANPLCSRLVPPISWITSSGSLVRVYQNGQLASQFGELEYEDESDANFASSTADKFIEGRFVEITVSREHIESTMASLRFQGFSKEDIYRMLDKGPWVLAFHIHRSLPKVLVDLKTELNLETSRAIHVLSHCPYLLAQYTRYKGRDLEATTSSLLSVGFTKSKLVEDCIRFPSMLSAPPDRIKGWRALLESFGIDTSEGSFSNMLSRAPFMYYINPPLLFDHEDTRPSEDDVSVTASGFVIYEALRILETIQSFHLSSRCFDRLVRSSPRILLDKSETLRMKLLFLQNLLLELVPLSSSNGESSESLSGKSGNSVLKSNSLFPHMDFNSKDDLSTSTTTAQTVLKFPDSSSPTFDNPPLRSGKGSSSPFIRSVDKGESASSSGRAVEPVMSHPYDDINNDRLKLVQPMLDALLYSYPTVINIETNQMRSVSNALRASGLRRTDVVNLIRTNPLLLSKDPINLRSVLEVLKEYAGFRKGDLPVFITKNPNILSANIKEMKLLIDYLYKSLGGTPEMLRRTPAYLSCSLDEYIRPRAEFLRAFHVDPLCKGLVYLITADASSLSSLAGVSPDIFNQFQAVFAERWRTRK